MPEDIEALKREKEELEEKYRSLAEIIEHLSKRAGEKAEVDIESKLAELNERIEAQISALKEEINSLKSKVGKPTRIKREIETFLEELREKSEPRLASLEEQIRNLQERLENLTLPGAQQVPTSITLDIEKFSRELNEVKDVVTLLKRSVQEFKQLQEPRLVGLEERVRLIEERVSDLVSTFGEENIRRLKEIITTTSEIYDNFIPRVVQREVEKRLENVLKDIDVIRDIVRKMDERMTSLNGSVSHVEKRLVELDKVKDEINFLYRENDSLRKEVKGERERILDDVNKVVSSLENRIASLSKKFERIEEIPKTYKKIIEENVLKEFEKVASAKFSEFNDLLGSVKDELEVVRSTHSDIRVAIDELTLKLNALEELQEKNVTEDDLRGVEGRVEELTKEVKALSEWRDKVEALLEGIKGKVDEIVLSVKGLMEVQEQVDSLTKMQHEVGKKVLGFERYTVKQEKLKEELRSLKKALSSVVSWKEDTEKRIRASLRSCTKLEKKIGEFDKKVKVLNKDFKKLERIVLKERNEIKERLNKLILELRKL